MDINQEWLIVSMSVPKQIVQFINEVFEVMEIRRKLGEENGIQFIVHSNESNHVIPHIHAKYGKYEVSIAIEDQSVLAGNLPNKNIRLAQSWVKKHKETLLNAWDNYTVSAISHTTKSRISD